jgi:hypothetical protein
VVRGDSFAKPNANDLRFVVPLDAPDLPRFAEPIGEQLAALAVLFEDGVKLSTAHGGPESTFDLSFWKSAYVYMPHSSILPHGWMLGDLIRRASSWKRPSTGRD